MIKEAVREDLHKRLFDLLVKRVELENALSWVQDEIAECVAVIDDDEREEIYASVDAYFDYGEPDDMPITLP